ncbi:multidrug resistance protein [Thermoplasma volcanium GSS1]|uniref:Multidrug resistance protein n=1 Tax=Thermoplasma volcanium (strain ATCC 51530 / DSM 4299 / JCM 9571 / NBRC 15438 / GSS1) TaxID=273116 RepID=Q978G3_THEVO|nr:MFS transporter [Thermoplasma volcanium]BAB60594.1 multidrug resistance protein [Thermoplasma volcanium GSS1]
MIQNYNRKYFVLSITTLGSLMAAIDSTIVFLALPSMGSYFSANVSSLSWIVVSYILSSTVFMIPSSDIMRKVGKKALYLAGFLIFGFSSLIIAVSPTIIIAIIFRFVEGIGAGFLSAVGIPILLDAFPPQERGKAVGINSISWAIGTLVGPVLGGYLVLYDWRYVFLINVPIGVVAFALGLIRIPKYQKERAKRFNPIPLLGLSAFLIPLTIGISFINFYYLAAAAIMFPIFIITQRRSSIIPSELLHNKNYVRISIASTLQALSFFGVLYALSMYLQISLHYSSLTAALFLFTYPLASMISNPLSGMLYDRTGRGPLLLGAGLVMQAFGIFMAAYTMKLIPVYLFIAGFGGSMFWAPSTTMVVDAAGPKFRGIANSSLFTLRNMSLIIGISIFPLFVSAFSSVKSSSIIITASGINLYSATSFYLMMVASLSVLALIPLVSYARTKKTAIAPSNENVE